MSKEQDRDEILKLVAEYVKKHNVKEPYKEGDSIRYAGKVYDEREVVNLVDSALEFWLTSGRFTREFEKKFGEYIGVRYVNLVNSGSSANLLAFMTLTSPLLKERRVNKGDEVITVAAGFPTTIAPIIQYGAVPVFVDVKLDTLNIDETTLEKAYSNKTKAVMLAHTLGNTFNIKVVKEFCDSHNLWLIEDNCDALGSEYELEGRRKKTGTFGDIGTSSFYPPHHMTMGEGGAVYTDNPLLHKIIRSLRDWGRDCVCESGHDNMCGHRYDGQYGQMPLGYDHKYIYSHFGYNLKATDMQAAIGCAQVDKVNDFTKKRREHFTYMYEKLSDLQEKLFLPNAETNAFPSWFGFPITTKEGIDRNAIVRYLEDKKIQTRMLFGGNIIKQPCFDDIRDDNTKYKVIGDLKNTDYIMEHTFWIGMYPDMDEARLDAMAAAIHEALK
ncbi:MAG: lipopolysaccharide biosynthesis protein RfbH [Lachnospiraceae bacterium]|nr:lipopolysaccharide biosynthesis protein RfbH [Lachnospiraceae bacterium]